MKKSKKQLPVIILSMVFINCIAIGMSPIVTTYQSANSLFVNSYEDYELKEGQNVETRIYEYQETRPYLKCTLQPVSNPSNIRTCEPSVE